MSTAPYLQAIGSLLHRLDTLGADGLRRCSCPQRVEVRFGVSLTVAPRSPYRCSILILGVLYAGAVYTFSYEDAADICMGASHYR